MRRNEVQLELAIDLFRAGIEKSSYELLAITHSLIDQGWTKGIILEDAITVAGGELETMEAPRPSRSGTSKMYPTHSTREVKPGGIQWSTEWVDPNNDVVPEKGQHRHWSGWTGLNLNQKWVMSRFCGEKGRYTLGIQAVRDYANKNSPYKGDKKDRKWVKPHYLMHSLSRRGLVTEIDKDVWILTPRGQAWVRTILGIEPTEKADGVHSVA